MKFAVVTKTPELESEMWMNLALPGAPVYVQVGETPEQIRKLGPMQFLALRCEVFAKGEILILNEDGREMCGRGRKPDKWGVSVEKFATVDEALARVAALEEEESAKRKLSTN